MAPARTSTRRIEENIAELAHEVTIVIVTHNMQQDLRLPQDDRTADYVHGRFG